MPKHPSWSTQEPESASESCVVARAFGDYAPSQNIFCILFGQRIPACPWHPWLTVEKCMNVSSCAFVYVSSVIADGGAPMRWSGAAVGRRGWRAAIPYWKGVEWERRSGIPSGRGGRLFKLRSIGTCSNAQIGGRGGCCRGGCGGVHHDAPIRMARSTVH